MGAMAQRLPFNEIRFPTSQKDLMQIETALKKHRDHARAATVCIKVGAGSGSGVIVSRDGLVLTAAHVVGGVNKQMKVVMEDGRELKAKSLGLNSETDAAMLKIIEGSDHPFVKIQAQTRPEVAATSEAPLLGDWVFALGHSGGFDKERGSVLRLGRVVRWAAHTMQSDCKLIGGDSGGPLFDMSGVLVGIHSRVGAVVDNNMHVPMDVFHEQWEKLLASEFIGEGPYARKQSPTMQVVEKFEQLIGVALQESIGGLKVAGVVEEGIAERAGMRSDDLLIEVEGKQIGTFADLAKAVEVVDQDKPLIVKVKRDEGVATLKLEFRVE